MKWMIYGASGYTGNLIAREAKRQGLTPVLAGRHKEKIEPIARELGFEWRAFDLEKPDLEGIDLVLHCAGPFSHTSAPLANALIQQGKHYLDITGEIAVFEALFAKFEEAKRTGSIVIPGVGFDVVPTDCLANLLKEKLPNPHELEMAMSGEGRVSPGTLKSMVEGFGNGGFIRRDGKLVNVPTLYKSKKVRFTNGEREVISIPWGDISTAYRSTGIPNIMFYSGLPKALKAFAPVVPIAKKIVASAPVRKFLQKQIEKRVHGPSDDILKKGRSHLWGRVTDKEGKSVEAWIDCPDGYYFTVLSSLRVVKKLLEKKVAPGVWTPAQAFGAHFIDEFPEVRLTY